MALLLTACGQRGPVPETDTGPIQALDVVEAETEVIDVPAPPPAPTVFQSVDEERRIRSRKAGEERLAHYQDALKQGDFGQAESLYRSLVSGFATDQEFTQFWLERVSAADQRELVVSLVCDSCSDGTCRTCGSSGECTICEGKPRCVACKGLGSIRSACEACVCRICGGLGGCQACRGFRKLQCPACRGAGTTESVATKRDCGTCGGRGYTQGLARANGGNGKVPCMRCGRRGYFTTSARQACGSCQGKGDIVCSTCGGKGLCQTCQGSRRSGVCVLCGNTGQITRACTECAGQGHCRACQGTASCSVCQGTGNCGSCRGQQVREHHRLAVSAAWLASDDGLRLISEETQTILSNPLAGPHWFMHGDRKLMVETRDGEAHVVFERLPDDRTQSLFK